MPGIYVSFNIPMSRLTFNTRSAYFAALPHDTVSLRFCQIVLMFFFGFLITSQVCFTLAVLGAVGVSLTMWYPHQTVSILFCVSWLGAWGFAQYSLALEMAAEVTFPVPEAITSGILIIFSQILSVVFVSFMQAVAPIAIPNALFTPACGSAATPQVREWSVSLTSLNRVILRQILLFVVHITVKIAVSIANKHILIELLVLGCHRRQSPLFGRLLATVFLFRKCPACRIINEPVFSAV